MDLTLNEIANIVDQNKGDGYLSQWFIDILSPLERRMKKLDTDKSDFSINDVFISSKKKKEALEKRYQRTLGRLMTSLRGYSDHLDKESSSSNTSNKNKKTEMLSESMDELTEVISGRTSRNIFKTYDDESNGGKKDSEEDKKEIDTAFKKESLRVHIESIDEKVLKLLGSISGSGDTNIGIVEKRSDVDSGKGGGFFSKLLKALGIGFALSGLWMLYRGFKDGGSLMGISKMLGIKAIKFLKPVIAGLLKPLGSFLFGEKGILTKFIKSGAGVVGGVLKKINPLPLIKSVLKKGISALLGPFTKPLLSLIKGVGGTVGKGAKMILKKIPFGIGAIISFFFAYSRFKKGDVVGGIAEIASGIASIVPVVGTAISFGIDALLAFRDATTTEEDRKDGAPVGGVDIGSWWVKIKNWVLSPFKKTINIIASNTGEELVRKLRKESPWLAPILLIAQSGVNMGKGNVGESMLLLGGALESTWIGKPLGSMLIKGANALKDLEKKMGFGSGSSNSSRDSFNKYLRKRVLKMKRLLGNWLDKEFGEELITREKLVSKLKSLKSNYRDKAIELRSLRENIKDLKEKDDPRWKAMQSEAIKKQKEGVDRWLLIKSIEKMIKEGNNIAKEGHATVAQASLAGATNGGGGGGVSNTFVNTPSNLYPFGDDPSSENLPHLTN